MAKILVSDPIADSAVATLKDLGHDVDIKTGMSPEELVGTIGDYECIIVRSATKLRHPAIDAAKNMKLIIRGGVGLDNIDVDYAREKGITVNNTPSASSDSVAELALAHLFSLYRYIPQANITMREGEWNKKKYKGREIAGKTLGIVGIGRIGKSLAKKALALGMNVIAYDPYVSATGIPNVRMLDKEALLADADVVSLHIPSLDKPFIGAEELAMMKDDAVLINCARGGVVDEKALLDALNNGKLWGAAIDVYSEEPPKADILMELINHPRVSVTPHIGATTKEAQDKVGVEIVRIVKEFF